MVQDELPMLSQTFGGAGLGRVQYHIFEIDVNMILLTISAYMY